MSEYLDRAFIQIEAQRMGIKIVNIEKISPWNPSHNDYYVKTRHVYDDDSLWLFKYNLLNNSGVKIEIKK